MAYASMCPCDKKLQAVFAQHISLIVKACRALSPELRAIILYGGFGRGEGSWYQNETGVWRPYNDYDICIVTEKKIAVHDLKNLKKKIAKEIGIKWVDVGQFRLTEMKLFRPSILNYDFKYASKVIDGDPAVLAFIPEINASTLPMKEVKILFFTRLYALIGSLNEKGLDQDLKDESARFFRNQMAKAILAIVDVLLLAKGAYDASYRTRVKKLSELYCEKKELVKLSQWALEEKLRPKAVKMKSREVRKMYESVHRHYFSEMYHALSLHFSKQINGPRDIEFCMKLLPFSLINRFSWLLRFRSLQMEKRVSVLLAQSYIAGAWSSSIIKKEFLQRGITLLRRVDSRVVVNISWDQARLEASRLRMEV